MRILVIEDNQEVARQIRTTLEQGLFVVDTAYDGEEGWFLGDTEDYDVVILDLGLPKMDGWQVFEELRKRASTRDIPIIVLTAHVVDHEHWAERLGEGDAFMAKPFLPDDLRHRIESLLAHAAAVNSR